ncbi:MAG: Gldg family protein [Clostridia bacterium]|nr:Gldg family protein [Clostridia bacterium]
MNLLKKRSRTYTGMSVALTVVVILFVMLLNAAVTLLSTRYSLYLDLTDAGLWTLSAPAKAAIEGTSEEVTITFCHDKDYIESSETLLYISRTAQELAKTFPWIHLRYINTILEPQTVRDYKYTEDSTIKTTNVIVERGDAAARPLGEKPSDYRIYSQDAFFITDTGSGEIWGYNGEEIFAAAILAVTADETPTAYFTTGHGETSEAALINTVVKAGFSVKTIDLSREEIASDARLIIVNNPNRDFAGYSIYDKDAVSEIAKLDKFLEENGTLMVFKSPEVSTLKNLEEYLYEWGVVFGDGVVRDGEHSLTADGYAVVADYPQGTLAASIHKDISALSIPPKTIVKRASPIYVSELYTAGRDENGERTNTYTYNGSNAYRELSAVLRAYPTAAVIENGETVSRGERYNLLTITRDMNTKDNDTYYSYVMAAGTQFFTTADYLNSNTYANEDILYYAFRVMGREKLPVNIDFKELAQSRMENITSAEATRTTVLLVTVLPLLSAAAGLVVVTRRKYR